MEEENWENESQNEHYSFNEVEEENWDNELQAENKNEHDSFVENVNKAKSFNEEDVAGANKETPWMAPENCVRRPVFASGDVYSVGNNIEYMIQDSNQAFIRDPLRELSNKCTANDPDKRPPLRQVVMAISFLRRQLTRD